MRAGPGPPRGRGAGSHPGWGSASHQAARLVVPVSPHSLYIQRHPQDGPQRGRLETDPERPGAPRLTVKASPPAAHQTCPGRLVSRGPGEPGPGTPGARVGKAGAPRHHLGRKGSGGCGCRGRSRPGDLGPDATWPRSRVQHRLPPGPGLTQGAGLLLHPPAPSTPGPGRVPR